MTPRARAPKPRKNEALEGVDPGRAAHASEEDVAHDDDRHQRSAEPVGHDSARDGAQRRAPAHDADDDVGHEQRRLQQADERADVAAFPAVAEHLHGGHEAVAFAERPDARADEEEA